jgi:hypothetical protein
MQQCPISRGGEAKMTKHTHGLALLYTTLGSMALIAASASAQAVTMQRVCQGNPCLYDAHNTLVGKPDPWGIMEREISGRWYFTYYLRTGIYDNLLTYYSTTDCSGTAYMTINDTNLREMQYDGEHFWSSTKPLGQFKWIAYEYYDHDLNKVQCLPYGQYYCGAGGCDATGSPAEIVETKTFYPPFTEK